jgi:penicillin-binding protein 1A
MGEKTKPDGSDYDIYKDGLKFTTIDSRCNCMPRKQLLHTLLTYKKSFSFNLKPKNAPFKHIRCGNTAHIKTSHEII